MMQLPALEMNEGAGVPGSPSSPGSDPGGTTRATTPREKPVQVLPCPRCESMNTKFCYYNNYSVTQPRHFCRQCQRYWTAGGTLRNVPVGGGSRKKNRPHHAQRPGEPYSQRSPGGGGSSSSGPFETQPGPLGFHQQHEIVLPGFALQQGHQYVAHQPYGLDQLSQLSSGVYASILNKPPPQHETDANLHAMFGNQTTPGPLSSIHPGGYFPPFQPEHTVKPEFWPVGGSNYQASRFESSSSPMVPNLGLNHPDRLVPQWDQSDMKPRTMRNGSSPLHDSSIEEEGSIPSNGYSKSGYEEGDAVSSMWHNLHDMDNLHLSVKW